MFISYLGTRLTLEEAAETFSRGLREAKQVVVLGDGAPWIWKLVSEQLRGAVQIVDLYHAQQHVWEVAHAVFGHSSPQATSWAELACRLLVHGQVEELVMAIAALPKIPPEPNESRSVPEKAVDYFTTNAQRMRYPAFRAESACMSAVASSRRLVKRWSAPARSGLACAGPPKDSMPCWPCVPQCSMRRTTSSGNNSHALLPKYLQLFHTPGKQECIYSCCLGRV